MIKEAITKLTNHENLSYDMTETVMDEIMSGKVSDIEISSYLTALAMKGETIDEISGSAAGMRNHAVTLSHSGDVLEIVGTVGDHSISFNISTTASIVLAAAGIPVAKHGNRAASSKSGAADVLEALGVNINISPEDSSIVLDETVICFLFAQKYHSAMKYVAQVRKTLGIRTIFNILGPLANPASATLQVMGVYDESLVEPLSEVLMKLGVKSGMVVYGMDCLDEISLSRETKVCEFRNGTKKKYIINPQDYGFTLCSKEDLTGGTPKENAAITLNILKGEKSPKRDAVVLNAAAGLYISKDDLSYEEAINIAQETIDSGKALAKLNEFIAASNK